MFLRELNKPPGSVKGVGEKTAADLVLSGISSVAALLTHYPRDWEDRSHAAPLKNWSRGPVCTTVKILAHDWFGFGKMRTLKIHVEDESARAVLVCFNRPFLGRVLEIGKSYRLWGKFYYKYGDIQSTSFEVEAETGAAAETGSTRFGGILPVYPLPAKLGRVPSRGQNLLRRLVRQALDQYSSLLDDEIPASVIKTGGFLHKAEAIRAIHFPSSRAELEHARQTLIFEELFYLEINVGRRAAERSRARQLQARSSAAAAHGASLSPLQSELLERLPFHLSPGQETAIAEINADMAFADEAPGNQADAGGGYSMARLLQGDVGSGKTLVAFLAALRAVDEGRGRAGQAAIMAPTELLARQHAENAARLLEPLGLRPAFLTGNLKARGRNRLLAALADGEVDIILGTHALFSKDVVYRNLRLVVVDEQHRFGVTQRQAILAKGETSLLKSGAPHLLMMSATPIPRTLALTVFGDLDVSVIPDMPPGRKPVKTHLAKESNAAKVYDFVRKELEAGRQAYFVYPLIGDDAGMEETRNTQANLKDAVSMAGELQRIFPQYPVALIHSRLDDEQKREAMESFRRGEIKILAATSVVEVGVDVPNASCMVVHHAERFGLSALHQLRGRVGRGGEKSYCFLIYSEEEPRQDGDDPAAARPALTDDGKQRLRVMLESNDGFVIAEEDLKLRGPGQIAGIEQSGYLRLGIADPVRDSGALLAARKEAFAMLERDPGLLFPENRVVAEVLERAPPFTETAM
ncbi:MAG: ATP-dependent DNA helicase RecG [Treponema sp.]|jgi:ATP-dependent DNA helicase RecG|nr:ATP-dependent DNA helicase RecG [Treponema sp.]